MKLFNDIFTVLIMNFIVTKSEMPFVLVRIKLICLGFERHIIFLLYLRLNFNNEWKDNRTTSSTYPIDNDKEQNFSKIKIDNNTCFKNIIKL